MPTFDAGVVSIMVRNSRIASAPGVGVVGGRAYSLQPAPNSEAMNPKIAINLRVASCSPVNELRLSRRCGGEDGVPDARAICSDGEMNQRRDSWLQQSIRRHLVVSGHDLHKSTSTRFCRRARIRI